MQNAPENADVVRIRDAENVAQRTHGEAAVEWLRVADVNDGVVRVGVRASGASSWLQARRRMDGKLATPYRHSRKQAMHFFADIMSKWCRCLPFEQRHLTCPGK